MWRPDQIADTAGESLRAHAARLDLEQAVHGIDAFGEVEMHPILGAGFRGAGFGVIPEWPYPGEVQRRARRAERERCDLVLTETPGDLLDPVAALKEHDAIEQTLFAHAVAGTPTKHRPEDALWIEVKLAGQFCYSAGVPGANASYATEVVSLPLADLTKLSRERAVRHAALLLILFTADQRTADHDLGVFMHRCLDRNLPAQSPSISRFGIAERIGNTLCTVAIVPVRPEAG